MKGQRRIAWITKLLSVVSFAFGVPSLLYLRGWSVNTAIAAVFFAVHLYYLNLLVHKSLNDEHASFYTISISPDDSLPRKNFVRIASIALLWFLIAMMFVEPAKVFLELYASKEWG